MSLMRRAAFPCLLLASALLGGCATAPQAGWWQHLGHSAREAALTPGVWAPLAGAAVFAVDDWDQEVSEWAVKHTPVFGSTESALQWSDDLLDATRGVMYLSVLAVPSAPESSGKFRTLAVDAAAAWTNDEATQALKRAVGRERPNGENRRSFPSGHTSNAVTHSVLASHNLRHLPGPWPDAARYSLTAMSIGTSWARIEGQKHYPGDVLAGAALGSFMAGFFTRAFLVDDPAPAHLGLSLGPDAWRLSVARAF